MLKEKTGFTLIELLVVVLIIGILAAIALPQYQKSVLKSKAVQALIMLRAITQAQERYYLESSGSYTNNLGDLDITVPPELIGTAWDAGDPSRPNVYLFFCANLRSCSAAAYNPNMPLFEFNMLHDPLMTGGTELCNVYGDKGVGVRSETARGICRSMGKVDPLDGNRYIIN